jgi:hypothetical protein
VSPGETQRDATRSTLGGARVCGCRGSLTVMHYASSAHARAVHTHARARPPPRISSAHMQCMCMCMCMCMCSIPRRAQDVFASQRLPRNYLLLAAFYVPRLSHRRSGYHLLLAPCSLLLATTCYLLLLATCYLLLATCSLPEVFASALFRMRCIAVVSPSGIRQSSKGCSTVRGVAR